MKIKKTLLTLASLLLLQSQAIAEHGNLSAQEALEKLKEGNSRFTHMKLNHPDQTINRRLEGLQGQHPFVVILTCSDSRVSPEIIFDQGLGDIFEIRNAGNILDEHVIGSIEYAVAHLDTHLVVILGHQDCGAVTAAIQNHPESKHIKSLVKAIKPAVDMARKQEGALLDNAIRNNIELTVKELKNSEPIIKKLVKSGKVKVIGAYYKIDSGEVDFYN